MMSNVLADTDLRLGKLKAVVGVLGVLGCSTALAYLLIGLLHLPILSGSPWAGILVMHMIIWPSVLGIVLGAGGGILAVRSGENARYFAILTTVIFVVFATTMYTMAYLYD